MTDLTADTVQPPLSADERQALADQEAKIEDGLKTFFKVGMALANIRDQKLYREQHATFEDYAWERWQLKRPRAYQLMDAAAVASSLSQICDIPPQVEAHAAAMKKLKLDEARVVWDVVRQTAPGGKVTETHVKSVVQVFKEVVVTQAVDDGSGEQIAVSDVIKAAVTEETYERMQRQKLYITGRQGDPPKRLVNGNRKIHRLQRCYLTFRVTPEEEVRLLDAADRGDDVRLLIYEVPKGDSDGDTEKSATSATAHHRS